jgi:hypothetical protein
MRHDVENNQSFSVDFMSSNALSSSSKNVFHLAISSLLIAQSKEVFVCMIVVSTQSQSINF